MSGIGLGVRELLPDQRFEFPNLTGWKVLGVRVFQLADDEFCEPPSPFRQHGHGLGHRESFVSLSLDRDSKHGTITVGLVPGALKETFDRTTMDREFAHDGEGRYAARQLRASRHLVRSIVVSNRQPRWRTRPHKACCRAMGGTCQCANQRLLAAPVLEIG
jgi:hypothetical protein